MCSHLVVSWFGARSLSFVLKTTVSGRGLLMLIVPHTSSWELLCLRGRASSRSNIMETLSHCIVTDQPTPEKSQTILSCKGKHGIPLPTTLITESLRCLHNLRADRTSPRQRIILINESINVTILVNERHTTTRRSPSN